MLADVYLFELQSFAASSGSPVFFEVPRLNLTTRTISLGDPRFYLIGLLKGHYRDVKFSNATGVDGYSIELN